MASRLQHHIPKLIHVDQNRFVPGRSTAHNIRRLHHIMARSKLHKNDQGCISLDLRQAFDSLMWSYMLHTIPKFGIPDAYTKWIALLYTNPTARARTGQHISQQYAVERGTRHNCPLSLLIFILAIEPLLARLRLLADHQGIQAGSDTHIASAYADDIILYLRHLPGDHTPLAEIFDTFQILSGLSINETKSYAFSFAEWEAQNTLQFGRWSFPIATNTFKYLGVNVYRETVDMLDGNITRAITSLRPQIKFWTSLPLSVAGRVAISKMVMLP